MSRIGKQPIALPKGVEVKVDGNEVTVKGPKGSLTQKVHPDLTLRQEDGRLHVERPTDEAAHRSAHGLTRTLVANMVEGVSNGFERTLDVIGVGYRTAMNGKNLAITVGYSHGIEIAPPPGIEFEAGQIQQTRTPFLVIRGIDKQLVGQIAAQIRSIRKPEPYKGKGIRYRGEVVRRKAGKAGKAGAKGGKS
jgi:large subunit ribosomal protein L6